MRAPAITRVTLGASVRTRTAALAAVGAGTVLALKTAAWWATGSVALGSDAAESIVNVVAAVTLTLALRVSHRPADYAHPYGHQKVEDLSSAVEGAWILLAAVLVGASAVARLVRPEPLSALDVGLVLSVTSSTINGAIGAWTLHVGRRHDSAALRSHAAHLFSDVWTSIGVAAGVGTVAWTGWLRLDALVALCVAAYIARMGLTTVRSSISRIMDERLPDDEERRVMVELERHPDVRGWHRLRTRRSGRTRFVEVDVFVDPRLTVAAAHRIAVALEDALARSLGNIVATIHVEPEEEGVREGATHPRDEYGPSQA